MFASKAGALFLFGNSSRSPDLNDYELSLVAGSKLSEGYPAEDVSTASVRNFRML